MGPLERQLTMTERTRARSKQLKQRQERAVTRLLGLETKPRVPSQPHPVELPEIYKKTWRPKTFRALERHVERGAPIEEAERRALARTRTRDDSGGIFGDLVRFFDPGERQFREAEGGREVVNAAKGVGRTVIGAALEGGPRISEASSGIKAERIPVAAATILANTAEHPVKTLTDVAKSAPGFVAGAAGAVIDPQKAGGAMVEDVKRRYGPYLTGKQSHKQFENQVDRDPAPYAMDLLASGVPVSRGLTLGARRLPGLRQTYSGARNPRPGLRVGAESRPQALSKGALGAPGQRVLDRLRARRDARAARAGDQEAIQAIETGAVRPYLFGKGRGKNLAAQIEATHRNRYQRRMRKEVREPHVELRKATRTRGKRDPVKEAALGVMIEHGARTAAELRDWAQRRIEYHERRRVELGERVGRFDVDLIPLLRKVEARADELATSKLRAAADLAHEQGVHMRELNPLLDEGVSIREAEPSARVLGLERATDEPVEVFDARARMAVDELSTEPPGYFRHTRRDPGMAEFALGHGEHVPNQPSTRYLAFDRGRYFPDIEAGLTGPWARSVKAGVAKDFAGDMVDSFALDVVKDVTNGAELRLVERADDGRLIGGTTRAQALDAIERGGLSSNDYALINMGSLIKAIEKDSGKLDTDALLFEGLGDALSAAEKSTAAGGWFVLRRGAVEHMRASAKLQGAFGRIMRRYLKGLPSRLILGTNPSWLILQVVNNGLMAVLAGIGPRDFAALRTVFADLKRTHPEEYELLMARMGSEIGGLGESVGIERLGASVTGHAGAGTIDQFGRLWDAWKASAITPGGRYANLSWLFKGDAINNAAFRAVVAANQAKVIKFRGLEHAFGEAVTTTDRLMASMRGLSARDLAELVRNPQAFESIGRAVDSVLGNYTRFTPGERAYLQGNIMFYGFLRFSTRFALYTLPVQHPFATAILAKLSELHEDEVRRLLGLRPDDPLPFDVLGSLYFVKDGQLARLPLQRINPLMNALSQNTGAPLSRLVQTFSPAVAELYSQISTESTFTGQEWRLGGDQGGAHVGEHDARMPSLGERGLHALDTWGSLLMPYRVWESTEAEGRTQADASVPFRQRYVEFAEGGDARKAQLKRERAARKPGYFPELGRQALGPLAYPLTDLDDASQLGATLRFQASGGEPRNPKVKRAKDELEQVEARKKAIRDAHPNVDANNPTPEYDGLHERSRKLNTRLHRLSRGKYGRTYNGGSSGSDTVTPEDLLGVLDDQAGGGSDTVTADDLLGALEPAPKRGRSKAYVTPDDILAGVR